MMGFSWSSIVVKLVKLEYVQRWLVNKFTAVPHQYKPIVDLKLVQAV